MFQDISRWPDIVGAYIRSKSIPSEIYGEKKNYHGAGVSARTSISPVSIIPPLLHTHSRITSIYSIILKSDSAIK